jgi:hypothetical protein
VYSGTIDGRLLALDARTGELVWSVRTTPLGEPYTITGAPRVVHDLVVIAPCLASCWPGESSTWGSMRRCMRTVQFVLSTIDKNNQCKRAAG